jgi:hypothetical protein
MEPLIVGLPMYNTIPISRGKKKAILSINSAKNVCQRLPTIKEEYPPSSEERKDLPIYFGLVACAFFSYHLLKPFSYL